MTHTAPAAAQITPEDLIEGSGTVGAFAVDVLEDFGLDNTSAQGSGEARLESLIKGKLLKGLQDQITGGDDISLGMGLILNQILPAIKDKKPRNKCEAAALNQAWGIAFDASHERLLRGAGNAWFSVLTAIPGAPALAEKLVKNTTRLAYEKTRAKLQSLISSWWAEQKDEQFTLTKSSSPCSMTMKVMWNKKKGKYLFLISGSCNCELVSAGIDVGGSIAMKSFEVIGGGIVTQGVDLRVPTDPKVTIRAQPPRDIKVYANCDCAEPQEIIEYPETPLHYSPAPRMTGETMQAKCEACEEPLKLVVKLVADFNALADKMDGLADLINDEPRQTPARDGWEAQWKALAKDQDKVEAQHDPAFQAFVACEETMCQEEGRIFVDNVSELGGFVSPCEACNSIAEEGNKLVAEHNDLVTQMDVLGDAISLEELHHGTTAGNSAYQEWSALSAAQSTLAGEISAKRIELSVCGATQCYRGHNFKKHRLVSGACEACTYIQEELNGVIKERNGLIDDVDEAYTNHQSYLEGGGDPISEEGVELSHSRITIGDKILELDKEESKLSAQLRACDPARCDVVDGNLISIGGETVTDGESDAGATSAGGSTLGLGSDGFLMPDELGEILFGSGWKDKPAPALSRKPRSAACEECADLASARNRLIAADAEMASARDREIDAATIALEACEDQFCGGHVRVLNVISLDGNNAFNPTDPMSTGPGSSQSGGGVSVVSFGGANIPVSRLSVATDSGVCSDQPHYHGSGIDCDNNSFICPSGGCGCGTVASAFNGPCANP